MVGVPLAGDRAADGPLLTENAAVLQFVAESFAAAKLMPDDGIARARLRQWLGFIGTELHKAVLVPMLDPKAPPEVKACAADKAALRLGVLQEHLATHERLLERFSVADAYLTVVLNRAPHVGIELAAWPAVQQHHRRMTRRPNIAKAIGEEFELYQAEQARRRKLA